MWPVFLYINLMKNLNKWTLWDWAIVFIFTAWIVGMTCILVNTPLN
jgi:hypothetical protein